MRLSRVAVPITVLAVMAGAAACTPADKSAPPPDPTPGAGSASPTPLPTARAAGSDGLTVRYRDDAGALKSLRVEDFPR